MKKLFAIILTVSLVTLLAACGNNTSGNNGTTAGSGTQQTTGSSGQLSGSAPLDILSTVWNSYAEDDKFMIAGGDSSEENAKTNEPGVFSIDDMAALDSSLGFPETSVDKIDSAASIMHMMNANTFTCGAYHVKSSDDVAAVAEAVKENIMKRQWMCGFPDKLVIMTVDDCVIAFFGNNEIVDTFKVNLASSYASAQTVCEDAIM